MASKWLSTSILAAVLFLVACGKQVAFPTQLPPNANWQKGYMNYEHNLSKLKRYQFRMIIPAAWKALDTKLDRDPAPGELLDVAAFREPGEWMTNPNAQAKAEIGVSVMRETATGALKTGHRSWLLSRLTQNAGHFDVLQERTVAGEPDLLLQYGDGTQKIIARILVVTEPDGRVFVLTATAPATEYSQVAEDLYIALQSFTPVDSGTGNTASGSTVSVSSK